jgi:2-dehydropantoate 2-reductase
MNWHILGAGALGCCWAANLDDKGNLPVLILRNNDRRRAFEQTPFVTYTNMNGVTTTHPCLAETACSEGTIHNLVIATKAFDGLKAFESIQQRLSSEATIILLQNGMGQQEAILEANKHSPDVHIWTCVSTDGAFLKGPFHAVQAGIGINKIGCISHSETQLPTIPLKTLKIEHSYTPWSDLWGKLAINAVINPMTAVHDCTNGRLISDPILNEQIYALCKEIETIAAAENQSLFQEPLYEAVKRVALGTDQNISSMLQDVRHKRPTEIDFISGFLLDKANKHAIEAPLNDALMQALLRKITTTTSLT